LNSVVWLFQQDWYIYSEFDSSIVGSAQWWDNYEVKVISLVILFQFFNNGALATVRAEEEETRFLFLYRYASLSIPVTWL
jgi:cation-transporting ATPase 13A3/4/5